MKKNFIKSPLNYIGGKHKIMDQLLNVFPKKINTFVDLFCGGCNVMINVSANNYLVNDNLTYLIELFQYFQKCPSRKVIKDIETTIKDFNLSLTNEQGYLSLRQRYNQNHHPLDLFVLTCFSFNHQIRFNSQHELNISFGKDRSRYNDSIEENLISFQKQLQKSVITFSSKNFDLVDLSNLQEDDFVYCDPPYLITTGSYNDGKRGFTGWTNHEEFTLLELLTSLSKRGMKFALSNVLTHKERTNVILQNWINANHYYVTNICNNYDNASYQVIRKGVTREVVITNYDHSSLNSCENTDQDAIPRK